MARLILEESGKQRAFKFQEGKLTIGSGEGCTLRLTSPNIAEIHCDLEFGDGRVVLRARPGVQPPVVNGEQASDEMILQASSVIQIGGATLHVELEETTPSPVPKAAAPRATAPKAAPKVAPRRSARAASVTETPQRSGARVQRTTRTMSGGLPTIAVVLTGMGVLGILAMIFFKVSDSAQGDVDWDPRNSYIVALNLYEDASYAAATDRLNKIDEAKRRAMGPELQGKFKALEDLLAGKGRETERAAANMLGTEWKSTQLDRFRNDRLSGKNPPRERVRVYLKRVKEFKTRWPTHPELQEVLRYEAQFKKICDLSEPATYSEIAYEVKTMTWAKPRNYKGAFIVVGRHLAANPGDAKQCEELLAAMRTEQAEHFNEMMLQAKYDWEKDQRGQAVAGLIQLITLLEDESLSDQAAEELVRLPGIDEWLRGYKSGRSEKFREIIRHPTIAAKARELGL